MVRCDDVDAPVLELGPESVHRLLTPKRRVTLGPPSQLPERVQGEQQVLETRFACGRNALAPIPLDEIERAGKGQAMSSELFDVYTGSNLEQGRKSLAYHVLLGSEKKTLTDDDAAKFLGRLDRSIGEAGGELRKE